MTRTVNSRGMDDTGGKLSSATQHRCSSEIIAVSLPAAFAGSQTDATAPLCINVQARLVDASGVPMHGCLAMRFRVVDDQGAVYPIDAPWSERHTAVQVHNGFFSVQLGSLTPFPARLFELERSDAPLQPLRFVEVIVET